ncbi:carbohydrate ABC transporter permease [Plantibacter sp. Mn2098]|uniref:carbohydrate ABC transporter permease n=1 Tax=Plantibacter sp. Mn2098 TaxID=3395266 RepID=UPI003BBF2F99
MNARLARYGIIAYLAIVSLLVILPVLYVAFAAFRPGQAITGTLADILPTGFSWEHFEDALRRAPLVQQMVNSALVTIAQTGAQVLTALLAAYALVFGRLRRPAIMFAFILITMMIPGETTLVANYLTIQSLGLFDTLVAMFLPYLVSAYNVFLLRQTFLSFPKEIHEAAVVDGVKPMAFLFRFLVPLNGPTVATVTLLSAIGAWNGYLWPLIVSQSPEVRTVQVGIKILTDESGADIGASLAGVLVAVVPTIILVIAGQRFLARGLTQGAVK